MPFNYKSMAGVVGIEPTLSESKSDMLPLHNTPTEFGSDGRTRTDDLHRMKVPH